MSPLEKTAEAQDEPDDTADRLRPTVQIERASLQVMSQDDIDRMSEQEL